MPLAALPAPANRRDDELLAATLDTSAILTATAIGPLPATPTVRLDGGYDYQPCRQVLTNRGMVGQIATRGMPAPIRADRRWVIERTHAWSNQDGKLRWCTERRRVVIEFWLLPLALIGSVGSSVAPGPTTVGKAAPAAAHDRLLAQALSLSGALTVQNAFGSMP